MRGSAKLGRSRSRWMVGAAVLAVLAAGLPVLAVPAAAAAPPAAPGLDDVEQRGSQIVVKFDETWADTDAPAVSPAITNYEYSTDGGVTWAAFDPPVNPTPRYNSVAGYTPAIGTCYTSDTGERLQTGSTYDVQVRAVNEDGPGPASDTNSVTMDDYSGYNVELNPCGGNYGGQDLQVFAGVGPEYFNMFQVARGGFTQVYSYDEYPASFCFSVFAQATQIGCGGAFYRASGVTSMDWDSVTAPVVIEDGHHWTVEQTGTAVVNGDTYTLKTTLEYDTSWAYVDVKHVLTTPDVSDLQQTLSGTASSGATALTLPSTSGLMVGMCASGTGIAAGTVVQAIPNGTAVTLSKNTTAAVSGSVTFTACAKLYHSSDMYLDGNDDGPGDASLIGGNRLVAQVTDPANIDPAAGALGGVGGIMEVSGYPFTSWMEDLYKCPFGYTSRDCSANNPNWGLNYGGSWPDTVDTDPTQDAGTAAEWSVNPTGTSGEHLVETWMYFASGSPTLTGGYAQDTATAGSPVTLELQLNNAPLWFWADAQFELALPAGASGGAVTSDCGGSGSVTAGVLTFTGGALDNSGLSCSISVPVTFPSAGVYTTTGADFSDNTITEGLLGKRAVKAGGAQALPASVSSSVTVEGGPPAPEPTPTPTPTPSPSPSIPPLAPIVTQTTVTVPPGGSLVVQNGVPVQVTVRPNATSSGIVMQGPGFELNIAGQRPDGAPAQLNGKGQLVVDADKGLAVSGTGFAPGTDAQIYILTGTGAKSRHAKSRPTAGSSAAILLGSAKVGANGTFASVEPIPSTLAPGDYVAQIVGYSPTYQVRVASLGMVLTDTAAPTKRVRTKVFFAPLSAALDTTAKAALAAAVKQVPKGAKKVTVQVVGFVQPTPVTGNDRSLSNARANSVAKQLTADGLKGRYLVSGRGQASQTGATARRVEVVIAYQPR